MARLEIALGTMAWAVALTARAAALGQEPPAERRAELMNLLVQDCGSCHGLTMKGGLGSPLVPAALEGKDVESLVAIILDGIPDTPMPPWRGQLSETEASWMAQQLKRGLRK